MDGEVAGAGDDEDDVAVGSEESDVVQLLERVGADTNGAGRNEFGGVGEDIVREVARDLVALEREGSIAGGAAAVVGMRAGIGIGCEIPEEGVPAPVAGGLDEDALDGLIDVETGRMGT